MFLLGLTAHSLITVLARSFYALKDTATPVAAALVAVAANIIVANLLIGPLGLNGLAAAIAISAWLETIVLVVLLVRRVPGIRSGMGHVWVVMAKTVVVSFAGATVAYAVDRALTDAWGVDPGSCCSSSASRWRSRRAALVILRRPLRCGSTSCRLSSGSWSTSFDAAGAHDARDVVQRPALGDPSPSAWDAFVEAQPPRVVPAAVGWGTRQGRQRLAARRIRGRAPASGPRSCSATGAAAVGLRVRATRTRAGPLGRGVGRGLHRAGQGRARDWRRVASHVRIDPKMEAGPVPTTAAP